MELKLTREDWKAMAYFLPAEWAQQKIAHELWKTWKFCTKVCVLVKWNEALQDLFIPEDTRFNRMVSLMKREIIYATKRHAGVEAEQEGVLEREWTLSGYDRSRCLESGRVMGYGGSTIPPYDPLEAD